MKNYLYIALAIAAWSFEYILIKAAATKVSPLLSGTIIFTVAGIGLYCFILFQHQQAESVRQIIGNLKKIALVGIIGTGCNILWIAGTGATAVANAAVLGRTDIFFSLILAVMVFHEKIRKQVWLFVPLIIFGLFLLLQQRLGQMTFGSRGDYMIIGSAFLLSLNAFIIKRSMKELSGATLALGNCIVNSFSFAVIQFFYRPGSFFAGGDYRSIGLLILCGICSSVFFIGYYKSLKLFPVWEVRLLTLIVPVLVALMGYLIFNATITLTVIAGGVAILLGAAGIIIFNSEANIIRLHLKASAASQVCE